MRDQSALNPGDIARHVDTGDLWVIGAYSADGTQVIARQDNEKCVTMPAHVLVEDEETQVYNDLGALLLGLVRP